MLNKKYKSIIAASIYLLCANVLYGGSVKMDNSVSAGRDISNSKIYIHKDESKKYYIDNKEKNKIIFDDSIESISYDKLSSPSICNKYIGKTIKFKIMYIGEWSEIDYYKMAGINIDDFIFINHRSVNYTSENNALGSSDIAYPSFPLSVSSSKSDFIYLLHRGDILMVTGLVQKPQNTQLGMPKIYIVALDVKKVRNRISQ